MESGFLTPAVATDAGSVAELVNAREASLYGHSEYSKADLVDEWADLDLEQNARVVRVGDRIVGYGAVRRRGERWDAEGYVHPDALARGIGKLVASWLEEHAARGGGRRIQSTVLEPDSAGHELLRSLGYSAVRVFREMRVALDAPPPAPQWPADLQIATFDADRDAREFHAAQEEAFAAHWEFVPDDFDSWSRDFLASERFDPTLWSVVRAGNELAAGAICAENTYGGGWVHVLFTRSPWRKKGVATALLRESFRRFWERGERSIGLGVDAANTTGAFRVYERAGMAPALGFVVYEKHLVMREDQHIE